MSLRMELLNNIASSPDPLHQVDLIFKRPLAYSKMECLVKEMQDEETGVPVRSQKVFLSSIPAAFAGYDIIEWLMERLSIEDSVEAIHLANLLCQHGYFFPVGGNSTLNLNFSVKDDSSLYRFQTPYYWPNRTSLTNSTDTSVDYAIYLSKRTLRSKPKHALDDHEIEAYNDLKRCLGNKWDFIGMQADEQIRLARDRKKLDKMVLDSQEKAYWRVVRPPPGVPCCIETPPTYNTQGQTKPTRKTNNLLLEDLRAEVELLRNSCIRTRIKVSTALESLANHAESYHEHDPFLVPRQPSNPWHSDDPTFWVLNADLVDIPTERRLKKWAISMEDVVFDPAGLREFTSYLRKEYCVENIRFWAAVRDMRFGPVSLLRAKAQEIYNEFLCPGSPCEINIDMRTMEAVQKELNFLVPSRFTFDPAAEHVYALLLKKDCYPRFIRSDHYKGLLVQSLQINLKSGTKRLDKFFSFVSDRKKKGQEVKGEKGLERDTSKSEQQDNLSSLADNIPYRGDLDNKETNLSGQNSLDDVCCPWETSSSVKSDRTTSTDKLHRIDHNVKLPAKVEKAVLRQKSLEEKSSTSVSVSGSKSEEGKEIIQRILLAQQGQGQGQVPGGQQGQKVEPPLEKETMMESKIEIENPSTEEKKKEEGESVESSISKPNLPVPTPAPNVPVSPEKSEKSGEEKEKPEGEKTEEEEVPESEEKPPGLKKQLSRKKSTTSSTSSADVCPWDAENGSAPEQCTFTKTYATLGYL